MVDFAQASADRETFRALSARFYEETKFTSSVTDILANEAFGEIVTLGRRMVPWILSDMRSRATWLGPLALRRILIGDGPVLPREHAGKIREVCDAWLRWAETRTEGT